MLKTDVELAVDARQPRRPSLPRNRGMEGVRALLTAGIVAGVIATTALTPAAAAPDSSRQEGLWYADALHLDEIHGEGVTGKGVTIAVIDSGINTQAAELQEADITLKGRWCVDDDGYAPPVDSTDPEISHHGTAVVSAIVGNGVASDGGLGTRGVAPDASIWFYAGATPYTAQETQCTVPQLPDGVEVDTDLLLPALELREIDELRAQAETEEELKWYPRNLKEEDWDASSLAALDAIRNGADVISVSGTSAGQASWAVVMAEAIREGVVVVGAIPNPGQGLEGDYEDADVGLGGQFGVPIPASLNGAVAVNAFDADARDAGGIGLGNLALGAPGVGLLLPGSSFAEPQIWGGTSFAAPMVSGAIALGLQKHPDATGHQVLQALIRTPGSVGLAEPHWEDQISGYGLINPRAMLKVDIPQMPDENPLFVTDPDDPRCTDWDEGQPSSVGECLGWAYWPEPADVWPQEYPLEETQAGPEQSDSGELGAEDPSEGDVTTTPVEPEAGGWDLRLVVGIAFIALLVMAGGIAVVVVKKKSSPSR